MSLVLHKPKAVTVPEVATEVKVPLSEAITEVLAPGIVDSTDLNHLRAALPSIEESFQKDVVFRTEVQIRASVLDDVRHPTAESKLKQSHREQSVQAKELFMLACEYHKKLAELERQEIFLEEYQEQIEAVADDRDRRRKEIEIWETQIEIARLQVVLTDMAKVAHHRIRELEIWNRVIAELKIAITEEVPEAVTHAIWAAKRIAAAEKLKAALPPADAMNMEGLLQSAIREVFAEGLQDVFQREIAKQPLARDYLVAREILKPDRRQKGVRKPKHR